MKGSNRQQEEYLMKTQVDTGSLVAPIIMDKLVSPIYFPALTYHVQYFAPTNQKLTPETEASNCRLSLHKKPKPLKANAVVA